MITFTRFSRSILFAFVLILAATVCHAQFTSGVEGTVKDPAGAVVPSCTVVVVNQGTGVADNAQTNESGYFRLASLPPGTYRIEIQQKGFKEWIQTDVVLAARQVRTLSPELAIGQETTRLEVKAMAAAVELSQETTSAQITGREVGDAPLNGNRVYSLALLTPGVTGTGQQVGSTNGTLGNDNYGTSTVPGINAAGQRLESNGFEVDGVYVMAIPRGGMIQFNPNSDGVEEIKTSANVFSAARSRNTGALVEVITKSGANQWHGVLSEYFTDNHLAARAEHQASLPAFTRNEFGGAAGGRIRKDKTFIFASWHSLRSVVSQLTTATVETPQLTSWVVNNLPNSIAAKILTDAAPFSFPLTGIQTVAQVEANNPPHFTPPANLPAALQAVGTANMNLRIPRNGNQWNVRLDHNFDNMKDRIYGQVYRTTSTQLAPNVRPNEEYVQPNDSTWVKADWTHTFSPTLVGEGSFSVFEPWQNQPGNPTTLNIPTITVPGISGFGGFFGWFGQVNIQYKYQLTWNHRGHSLQMGYEGQRFHDNTRFQTYYNQPSYTFASLADFIQDLPITQTGPSLNPATASYGAQATSQRYLYSSPYIQDDWKVTSHFTLNLGLRYTDWGKMGSAQPYQYGYFTPGPGSTISAQIASGGVVQRPLATLSRLRALDPRVGFAWDVFGDGKTSLRAGYGIFHDRPFGQIMNPSMRNPPEIVTLALNVLDPTGQYIRYGLGSSDGTGFPIPKIPISLNSQNGVVGSRITVGGIDPNLKLPQIQSWMVGIQRLLNSTTTLEVNYSGTAGSNLFLSGTDVNRYAGDLLDGTLARLNPNFGVINYVRNGASSISHVGSLAVTKRFSRSYALTGLYTFSKSIDTNSTYGTNGEGIVGVFDWTCMPCQRGPSAFDVRQHLAVEGSVTLPDPWHKGPVSAVLGGWRLLAIAIVQTGEPFTVITSQPYPKGDYNRDGYNLDRPNAPSYGNSVNVTSRQQWFNGIFLASDFPTPTPGLEGNLGVNTFREPGLANVDMNLVKSFRIPWFTKEGANFELRGQFFNLFNHPNLGTVGNDLSNASTFGKVTTSLNPRYIQFAARVSF